MAISTTAPEGAAVRVDVAVVERQSVPRRIWNSICRFASWIGGGIREFGRACSRAFTSTWERGKEAARGVWAAVKRNASAVWAAVRGAGTYVVTAFKALGGFISKTALAIWHGAATLFLSIGGPIWWVIAFAVTFLVSLASTEQHKTTQKVVQGAVVASGTKQDGKIYYTNEDLDKPWGKDDILDLYRVNAFLVANTDSLNARLEELRSATALAPEDYELQGRLEFLTRWIDEPTWVLPKNEKPMEAMLHKQLPDVAGRNLGAMRKGVKAERKDWLASMRYTTTVNPA